MRRSSVQHGNGTTSGFNHRQFIARGSGALAGFNFLRSAGCVTGIRARETAVSSLVRGFEDPPLRARPGAYRVRNDGYSVLEQRTRELDLCSKIRNRWPENQWRPRVR